MHAAASDCPIANKYFTRLLDQDLCRCEIKQYKAYFLFPLIISQYCTENVPLSSQPVENITFLKENDLKSDLLQTLRSIS